jgi:hypothetical protein
MDMLWGNRCHCSRGLKARRIAQTLRVVNSGLHAGRACNTNPARTDDVLVVADSQTEDCFGGTPKPTRETRALPGPERAGAQIIARTLRGRWVRRAEMPELRRRNAESR